MAKPNEVLDENEEERKESMMNKKMMGVLGLASVALVGGTFAYFTQTSTIDNPFDTARYSTVVTEDFNPEDGEDWQPGAQVNKDLYVQNTGDRDVVVRVKFQDFWYRGESMIVEGEGSNVFHHLEGAPVTNPRTPNQRDVNDGETEKDGKKDDTVVFKTFANTEKWSDLQEDGYYYYLGKLAPNTSTEKFLDMVQLDPQVDMGHFQTKLYSKIAAKGEAPDSSEDMVGWTLMDTVEGTVSSVTAYKLSDLQQKLGDDSIVIGENESIFTRAIVEAEEGKKGYSDANYILRITVETVQATDQAVKEVFSTLDEESAIYKNWQLDKELLEES